MIAVLTVVCLREMMESMSDQYGVAISPQAKIGFPAHLRGDISSRIGVATGPLSTQEFSRWGNSQSVEAFAKAGKAREVRIQLSRGEAV